LRAICQELVVISEHAQQKSIAIGTPNLPLRVALSARPARPVIIEAVNDIEELTTNLSSKIWQKIAILDSLGT
jgi:hypothetical protein